MRMLVFFLGDGAKIPCKFIVFFMDLSMLTVLVTSFAKATLYVGEIIILKK